MKVLWTSEDEICVKDRTWYGLVRIRVFKLGKLKTVNGDLHRWACGSTGEVIMPGHRIAKLHMTLGTDYLGADVEPTVF